MTRTPSKSKGEKRNRRMLTFLLMATIVVTLLPSSQSLPFILLHGMGDECATDGMTMLTGLLANQSGQEGTCLEIGNGVKDSWFMPLTQQVELACEKVKSLSHLQDGYNIVALSQGNLIARGLIEWCDRGPSVHNMISLGGPHAGVASIPFCVSGLLCELANLMLELGVYTSYVQNHLAPAGFVKIPTDLLAYYKGCRFLPKLNNELPGSRNATYKKRISSLNHLVLIMFEQDEVLIPRETAWFGYYAPNSLKIINSAQETDLYKEDWIGLKELDNAGRVSYIVFPGGHLHISQPEVQLYIVPHLVDSTAKL